MISRGLSCAVTPRVKGGATDLEGALQGNARVEGLEIGLDAIRTAGAKHLEGRQVTKVQAWALEPLAGELQVTQARE